MELAPYRHKMATYWNILIIYYCNIACQKSPIAVAQLFIIILPLIILFEILNDCSGLKHVPKDKKVCILGEQAPHGRGERQRADVHERRRPQEVQQRQEADQELRFDYQP